MRSPLLICIALLVTSCPSWAGDQEERFLEFQEDRNTLTYDFSTVELIAPGRFTVIHTTIDAPDVMKLELKAFATLQLYCARPDGKYPVPSDVFLLGPPDLPVENIEVKTNQTKSAGRTYSYKTVSWDFPYKKLAFNAQETLIQYPAPVVHCRGQLDTESEYQKQIMDTHSVIMNGIRTKELFDCKRGQVGSFIGHENDDPAKAMTYFVRPDTRMFRYYLGVCYRVTHETPYTPE
jgi:hypothetical protein